MNLCLKRVPKAAYAPKKACVYVMSRPELLADPPSLISYIMTGHHDTYVGVTANAIKLRWKDHKAIRNRKNQKTAAWIEHNEYDFDDCFRVIFEGTLDQCYKLEYHMRPDRGMGLNRAIGGQLKHRKHDWRYHNMIAVFSIGQRMAA